jgi:hypothetical protein
VEYVLPLKTSLGYDAGELGKYVRGISSCVRVIVVDGSCPEQFLRNGRHFAGITHVPPKPAYTCANGKVRCVRTGLDLCRSDKIVIADDDVRYEPAELARIETLLDDYDLVRPQNHFHPTPWHAQWDTARSLLNRALGRGDFPGTLALRLTAQLRRDGYDGDVLFENLELIRTVRAGGGRELICDLYVRRLPPTVAHFLRQRVRQAYDSQAQPGRLLLELALLPGAIWAARRPVRLIPLVTGALGLAEIGRRKNGGAAYFGYRATLFAPIWILERALCVWFALAQRFARGGAYYAGQRIRQSAHSERWLRRAAARRADCSTDASL